MTENYIQRPSAEKFTPPANPWHERANAFVSKALNPQNKDLPLYDGAAHAAIGGVIGAGILAREFVYLGKRVGTGVLRAGVAVTLRSIENATERRFSHQRF